MIKTKINCGNLRLNLISLLRNVCSKKKTLKKLLILKAGYLAHTAPSSSKKNHYIDVVFASCDIKIKYKITTFLADT